MLWTFADLTLSQGGGGEDGGWEVAVLRLAGSVVVDGRYFLVRVRRLPCFTVLCWGLPAGKSGGGRFRRMGGSTGGFGLGVVFFSVYGTGLLSPVLIFRLECRVSVEVGWELCLKLRDVLAVDVGERIVDGKR